MQDVNRTEISRCVSLDPTTKICVISDWNNSHKSIQEAAAALDNGYFKVE